MQPITDAGFHLNDRPIGRTGEPFFSRQNRKSPDRQMRLVQVIQRIHALVLKRLACNYVSRKHQITDGVLQTDGGFEKVMKLRERHFSAPIRPLCRPLFPDCHVPDRNL
jgi:hypothetical protein